MQEIWNDICEKCRGHCSTYVHLVSGREQQHILTDQEITELAKEVNFNELLDLLIVENISPELSVVD